MKTIYRVAGYLAHSEQDNYEIGCHSKCLTEFMSKSDFTMCANSLDELIEGLRIDFCANDINDFLLNSCEELGRLDLQVLQREPFKTAKPNNKTMQEWKDGKFDLWLTCYTFHVEIVQCEIDLQAIFESENNND